MLNFGERRDSTCQGVSRRAVLRVGVLSALGLSLPDWLAARAANAELPDVSCILLWMGGGPSNMDTFDMKPRAPLEYRGEFRPISSNVPGVDVCEHLPNMARQMDKICLVKSVSHPSTVHVQANHFMLTGYQSVPPVASEEVSALVYPSYGSVISREQGWQHGMPPYVRLGAGAVYAGAGYMGGEYNPLQIKADPAQADFRIDNVAIPEAVGSERTARRRAMLAALDRWQQQVDSAGGALLARSRFYEQAYDLVSSPAAKRAFDLSQEPAAVRDRYGRDRFGQSTLLARRLVEAGVRFVSMETGRWDTHQNNFKTMRDEPECLPSLDRYWPALLEDLDQRGMLDTTLVVWMGEFGRTPKVNGQGGRDHWGRTNAICLAGAGIKPGTVVGQTDKHCAEPVGTVHSTHDFAATIYHLLGIDTNKEFRTPDGRPVLINYHGRHIREALA